MESSLMCELSLGPDFSEYPQMEQEYISYLSSSKVQVSGEPHKLGSYLTQEIQKVREHIKSSLENAKIPCSLDTSRIDELEKTVNMLVQRMEALELHINKLNCLNAASGLAKTELVPDIQPEGDHRSVDEDDNGLDLFASDDKDDAEGERIRAERVAQYAAKKAAKPGPVAKSSIILDVKPWSDETDMVEMESLVRSIKADGLAWGQSKLVPLAYGIKKLQIACVVEDDKIGTDFLEENITQFEDHVQSVDIVSFNKV
ncbi:Elongation factor 1 delta [Fasciola gigantica]|uniref:Elongation factor 1 delta n=1 Tax=Fasciola gigantica TaxID=46835 RepID=A0A504YPD4_FASGI|nr:Elongation factor 1 delta [Fasciola gigantica]